MQVRKHTGRCIRCTDRGPGGGQEEGVSLGGGEVHHPLNPPRPAPPGMEPGHAAPGQNFGDHLHEATVQTAQEWISICSMLTEATAEVGVLDRCFRA